MRPQRPGSSVNRRRLKHHNGNVVRRVPDQRAEIELAAPTRIRGGASFHGVGPKRSGPDASTSVKGLAYRFNSIVNK